MTDFQKSELKQMQDAIYREKILRARSMTKEERLQEVFDQSELQIQMMLAGAMHKLGTTCEAEGWKEVERWIEKLDYLRDSKFYKPF
ncbi:MAG: hypothetical protein P1U89_25685 [Verrucomicrobiales bacterium]|nr:hypothetical protein [Verrucomicrobiales bacterium]